MNNAQNIMSKKAIAVELSSSVLDVAKLMDKNKVSGVIITKDGKPYGIITERDMLSKISSQNKKPSEVKAGDIMSFPLVIVTPLTPVDEIVEKMILNKIRRIVVSNGDETLGIITVTDFIKHFHSMLSSDKEYNKKLYQDLIEDWEYWAY